MTDDPFPDNPFDGNVIVAVTRHMNDDHPEDSLAICQALGGVPAATAARLSHIDGGGFDFEATVNGEQVPVRVRSGLRMTARADIRMEVVRLYDEALAVLGRPPRSTDGDH